MSDTTLDEAGKNSTWIEVVYEGARVCTDGSLGHFYAHVGGEGAPLTFAKRIGDGWHRPGDVLKLAAGTKPNTWRLDGGVLRHIDSPELEAADVAARQHVQAEKLAKRNAGKSDLDEALRPLQRAYSQLALPQRAAFIAWLVRKVMSWRNDA